MGQVDIWRGLEREIYAEGGRAAFEQACQRHEALRHYPDLATAVGVAAACRCEERDAIVGAFVAEHRASRAAFWAAAAILATAPLLASLMRALKRARRERNDEKSIVLAAFLEAVNHVGTAGRITLRLYSETRRRVLRPRRRSVEDRGHRSSKDVAELESGEDGLDLQLDQIRVVRRADAMAPEPGERPAAYIERLAPSDTGSEAQRRRAVLRNQRSASLAELREAFRSIAQPQHDGEKR
jgi:hypothetical protein